jgi:hypothetical protein
MSEWITDRLPTEEDSDMMNKVWVWEDNAVYWSDYSVVTLGTPWMPNKIPAPYVKPEPQRWKPDNGDLVCYNSWCGDTRYEHYCDHHDFLQAYNFGNVFQTRDQAIEAARRVRELLLNYHKELNNE